jgi:Transmembrane protein 43
MAADDDTDNVSSRDGEEVTETGETSWLSRLGQSFAGIIFGILLIVASCVLLFWNEGRAVTTARSLTEGAGLVRTVAADKVDPANEGRLVHVTGTLSASGPATDSEFGVKSDSVRLVRHAEMFQWTEDSETESQKKLGGGETTKTTYKYKRDWVDKPVDSSKFHSREGHANPQMTWRARQSLAPGIKLGAFSMPDTLMRGFGSEEAFTVGDDQVAVLQKRTQKPVQAIDGALYVGKDPAQPSVGDFKITFAEVKAQAASVVARQAGPTFEAYRTRAGGNVELVAAGSIPASDMFKSAQDDNRMWTWLIRLGGCVAMFIGFALIMSPLSVLADVIPILGDIVGAGTSIVAFLCTVAIAPVVIAIAWFTYRPVVALITLVVGGALVAGGIYLARQRKAGKTAAAHA